VEFVEAVQDAPGILQVDITLTDAEVRTFQHKAENKVRADLEGLVELYYPSNHPVQNPLRVIVADSWQTTGESIEDAGYRIFSEIKRIAQA
jgi:hypothetical protein